MTTKTVLIIADSFPPGFAPRMGYLSKFLGEYGWKGIAVSPMYNYEKNNFDFLSGHIPHKGVFFSKQKKDRNFFHKALSIIFPDMRIAWGGNKKIKSCVEELMIKEHVDIILCSTCELFPLNIAYKIAKKYKIPWVADLRDIYEQYTMERAFLGKIYQKTGIQRRNFLLEKASAIVTVSKKHVETLGSYGLKACPIYNGADTDVFIPSQHSLDKFRIVYTGTLVTLGGRDVSPLFSVIQQLHINKEIDYRNCRIQFYSDTESHTIVNKLKPSFCVSDFIDCFNYIPVVEVPKVLNEAAVLLLFLDNENKGIMTTKFFEYLAVKRPVLSIWSDKGEVEEIINNFNAGIAARTEADIKSFIKSKYDEWLKTKYTVCYSDCNDVGKFSRRYAAKQFTELFDIVLKYKNSV